MALALRPTLRRPADDPPAGGHGAVLATLCVVLFLTFLDNTVVSVALAGVQSSLHAGVTSLQWVVNGYALVFAAFMLAGGTLGDLFGRKRVMLIGIGVFCAGSVVAATAVNVDMLIAGRVVMGLGAAASEPGTLSIIRHVFPDRSERARALGLWAAVSGLALALGPVVAGVLMGLWNWRAVFWFNLVLGAVAAGLAARAVPESSDRQGRRVDWRGLALGALVLGAATTAVIEGEESGYATGWIVALFVLAALAAVGFLVAERRSRWPMLDLAVLRRPAFVGANLVAFLAYFGTFAIFFFVALYLQLIVGASPFATAEDFLPMTVGMVAAAALTGRWVARRGARIPMTAGCLLAGAGLLLTSAVVNPHVGLAQLGWVLPLAGIGFGVALVPVTSAALTVVEPEHSGMAASVTNTSRELGAVFGVAVLGALVNGRLTSDLVHRLKAIGVPANFNALIITAVTHGGLPQGSKVPKGSAGFNAMVAKVIEAAKGAFSSGLHLALDVSGALLLVGAVVAFTTVHLRRAPSAAGQSGARGLESKSATTAAADG